MKGLLGRVLLAGSFTVLLVALAAVVLTRAVELVHAVLASFGTVLPLDTRFPNLFAVLALVVLVFIAGLLLQVQPVRGWVNAGRDLLAERFPILGVVHTLEARVLEGSEERSIRSALADPYDDGALVPAFVMEELADGRYVVFVPTSPRPSHGSVYILPRERVQPLDASFSDVAHLTSRWGVGTKKMLEAKRKSASGQEITSSAAN
jgi:uncharacterized membrane protein